MTSRHPWLRSCGRQLEGGESGFVNGMTPDRSAMLQWMVAPPGLGEKNNLDSMYEVAGILEELEEV